MGSNMFIILTNSFKNIYYSNISQYTYNHSNMIYAIALEFSNRYIYIYIYCSLN